MYKGIIAVVCASVLAVSAWSAPEPEKFNLKLNYKDKAVTNTKWEIKLSSPGLEEPVVITVNIEIKETVGPFNKDGSFNLKSEIKKFNVYYGKDLLPDMMKEPYPVLNETMSAQGKLITAKMSGGDNPDMYGLIRQILRPVYSATPVARNDIWKHEIKPEKPTLPAIFLQYEVVAKDKIAGADVLKLKTIIDAVEPKPGDQETYVEHLSFSGKLEGFIWVDLLTGQTVKASMSGKNIVNPFLAVSDVAIVMERFNPTAEKDKKTN